MYYMYMVLWSVLEWVSVRMLLCVHIANALHAATVDLG